MASGLSPTETNLYPLPTGAGFIDPSFPNPNGPDDASIIIYGFTPSLALCIIAIVLFTLAMFAHGIRCVWHRSWYFVPVPIACVLEVVGYAFRTLSSQKDPYRVTYFVVQYFLIVVAPVFISAGIYICLSKLISWALRQGWTAHPLLRPKIILWIFISFDVATTIIQIAGAALIGSKTSKREDPTVANNILLGGLAVQCVAFAIFMVLLGIFTWSTRGKGILSEKPGPNIGILLYGIWTSSILVLLRTTFRLAETADGVFSAVRTHEIYFAVLEFVPIIVAVLVFVVIHPGYYFSRN